MWLDAAADMYGGSTFPALLSCPTPSHTPDYRAHSRISGIRSSLDTPLSSYAYQRYNTGKSNEDYNIKFDQRKVSKHNYI